MDLNFKLLKVVKPSKEPVNIKKKFAKLTLASTKKQNNMVSDDSKALVSSSVLTSKNLLDLLTDDEDENEFQMNKLLLTQSSIKSDTTDSTEKEDSNHSNIEKSVLLENLQLSDSDGTNSSQIKSKELSNFKMDNLELSNSESLIKNPSEDIFSETEQENIVDNLSYRVEKLKLLNEDNKNNEENEAPKTTANCKRNDSAITVSSTLSTSFHTADFQSEDDDVIIVSDSDNETEYNNVVSSLTPKNRLNSSMETRLNDFFNKIPPKCNLNKNDIKNNIICNGSIESSNKSNSVCESSVEIPESESESSNKVIDNSLSHHSQTITSEIITPQTDEVEKSDTKTNEKNEYQFERINISAKIQIKLHISQPIGITAENNNDSSKDSEDNQNSSAQKDESNTNSNCISVETQTNKTSIDKKQQIQASVTPIKKTPKKTPLNVKKSTEINIDEKAKALLDDVYGNEWRTPEVMKIFKKQKLLKKTQQSRIDDFSLFHRQINSDLESTRIPKIDDFAGDNAKLHLKKNKIDGKANEKLNKLKSGRIVKPRVIVNDSSEDDTGSNSDFSFINDETDSDESFQCLEKETNKKSSVEDLVYLDLSKDIVEVQQKNISPPANHDNVFEKRLQKLLETCEFKAPAKMETPKNKTTKRKLFTPNFGEEDEQVLENNQQESNKGELEDISDKLVKLRTPLPAMFDPINKQLESVKREHLPLSDKKKIQSSRKENVPFEFLTPKLKTKATETKTFNNFENEAKICTLSNTPKDKYSFLKSFDVTTPQKLCHPVSLIYRTNYKTKKYELAELLLELYNSKVFNNKLDVKISWNKKLTNTAGRCVNSKKQGKRTSRIELSEKVLTSADRLRCTLIHEMCHAMTWIIDESVGHGPQWKAWTQKANHIFPELPKIEVCHNYDIEYKYTYKCTLCGSSSHAHSKSKKVDRIRCAFCHGSIEIFLNRKDKEGKIISTPVREPTGFAKFVKEKYKEFKRPELKHAEVMKILSDKFSSCNLNRRNIVN